MNANQLLKDETLISTKGSQHEVGILTLYEWQVVHTGKLHFPDVRRVTSMYEPQPLRSGIQAGFAELSWVLPHHPVLESMYKHRLRRHTNGLRRCAEPFILRILLTAVWYAALQGSYSLNSCQRKIWLALFKPCAIHWNAFEKLRAYFIHFE